MATFLCHPSVSLGFETLAMKTWVSVEIEPWLPSATSVAL